MKCTCDTHKTCQIHNPLTDNMNTHTAYTGKRDPIYCPALQPEPKMEKPRRIKIKGVKGYATLIHGKGDFIEGDVLHYDRALSKAECKRVEAFLKGEQ